MVKTARLLIFAAAVCALWSAGAHGGQTSTNNPGTNNPGACVRVHDISGYSVIDCHHLVLNGEAGRHYLITTRTRCSGLRPGVEVGLSFTSGAQICTPISEYIIPDDGWRCAIGSIEEVDSEEAARALIAARCEE